MDPYSDSDDNTIAELRMKINSQGFGISEPPIVPAESEEKAVTNTKKDKKKKQKKRKKEK